MATNQLQCNTAENLLFNSKNFTTSILQLNIKKDFDIEGNLVTGKFKGANTTTIVFYYLIGCRWCSTMACGYENFARHNLSNNSHVIVAAVNMTSDDTYTVDEKMKIAKNFKYGAKPGISGFPTIIAYQDGKVCSNISSKRTNEDLQAFVDELVVNKQCTLQSK